MSGLKVAGNEGNRHFPTYGFSTPNTCRYCNKFLQEKKQAYNERILQIDHGTFTPLVFSIDCSMGRECQTFYSRLAQMISEERDLPQSISSRIQTKVCFGLLKSGLLCLRGSITVCRKTVEFEIDVDVSHTVAKI